MAPSPVRRGPHARESTPDLLSKGPGFVLYAMMDFIVDQYFPIVDALEEELEALEDASSGSPSARRRRRIYKLKRDLLDVKRGVAPLVDVGTARSALEVT